MNTTLTTEMKRNAEFLGIDKMAFQTMEEASEITKACSRLLRLHGLGQTTLLTEDKILSDLSYAIADMKICLSELEYLLDCKDDVNRNIQDAINAFRTRNNLPPL